DVDVEAGAVIVLPRDGGEQVADHLALIAGGDDDADPALCLRARVTRLLEGIEKPDEPRDIGEKGYRCKDDVCDEKAFEQGHARPPWIVSSRPLYPTPREKSTLFL